MPKVLVDAAVERNRQVKLRQWGRSAWWRGGACFILLVAALTGCIPSDDAPPGPNRAADLANLELSEGALSPAFGPDELNYTVSVGSNISSITITPTVADARATVKVNNTPAQSGQPFGPVNLALGTNPPITILVDAPGISKTYTMVVTRAPNADLKALQLSAGALAPAFSPNVTNYMVETGFSTPSTTVTATVADDTSTMTINGNAATSGQPSNPITLNVGSSNVITIRVTAANSETKDYQITVLKTGTTNLASLSISAGPIAPAFNPTTLAYTVSTGYPTDQTTITLSTADSTAAVTVNGQGPVQGGGTFGPFPLAAGQQTPFTIVVTSPTVASKTYTVTITRQAPSSNANLSSLTVNQGTLSPSFNPGIFGYTVNVGNSVTSINVTATVQDPAASLQINNSSATSGQPFTVGGLVVGANGINIVVTPQSGPPQLYTVTVNRAAPTSGNSNLGSLAVSPGTLQPPFNPNTNNYNVSVSNATTSVVVTATTQDGSATMTINNQAVQSGQAFTVGNLQVGNNTVTIRVTAPAGNAENYVVTVNRAAPPSSNANLSNLTVSPGSLSPGFSQSTLNYNVSLPFANSSINVTPTAASGSSTITVNGQGVNSGGTVTVSNLVVGNNVIIVRVTAQAGNLRDYVITVNRAAASSNANLSNLTVSPGSLSPGFNPSTQNYNVSLLFANSSINVTPTAASGTSTITVNGQGVSSGGTVTVGNLQVGNNTVTVRVTAQAGNSQNYVITVNRAGLSSLALSAGALSPSFSSSGFAYNVTTTQTSTTVTAMVQDSTATMTLLRNGVSQGTLSNGVASAAQPLALAPAINTLVVQVTAQAGNTQNYTITVTRNP
ncbi:MAG: cadherin-like beta sandwich domain-containing protein [Nitrospiraceae bacterium]